MYVLYNGKRLLNDSYINLDQETNFRIDCNTNKTDCCRRSMDGGNWYFPSGELVDVRSNSMPPTFILTRRTETVSLSVYGLGVTERGYFLCEIPNSNDVEESIYIRLRK